MSTIRANSIVDAAGGNTATVNGTLIPTSGVTLVSTNAVQTLTNKIIDAVQLTGDVAAARITTALNASGSAPIYACRAWVNFNGTGTVAIRASGNVTSITDNVQGNYTVNFTTAMPDTNYCVVGLGNDSSADTTFRSINLGQTSNTQVGSCQIFSKAVNSSTQVFEDLASINVAVFR